MKKLLISLTVLLICTVASQNARAQADIGFKSVGISAGLVNPEDLDATLGFGAFADLGTINPNIRLSAHLDYWSHSEDVPGGGDASVGDISVTARGKYMFEVAHSQLQPYAGAGLGLHFLHSEIKIPDQVIGGITIPGMTADDSATKLGLDIGGGFQMPINPKTDFVTDAWFSIVDSVNMLSLKVGVAFKL
jgi:Outer membrane protein beta-barrel domain